MKSLKTLSVALIQHLGAISGTDVSRDIENVARRFDSEGEQFLTITLPNYAKALERALELGDVSAVSWPGFKVRRGFPLLFGGALRRIFDEESCKVLDCVDVDVLQCLRQVCLVASKIFEVCDEKRANESVASYVECENEMEEQWYHPRSLREIRVTLNRVFGASLRRIESAVSSGSIIPSHGPGSTADRLSGNRKYDSGYWTERLNRSFPVADYLLAGYSHEEVLDRVQIIEPGAEMPVRVITVPKTAAKARIIAMEPTNVQYVQQALWSEFRAVFSGGSPFVDFSDQGLNRELARKGSLDGSLATLDLSEASDRVAVEVVEYLFGDYPSLQQALLDSRSTHATLPDGRTIALSKFASMGSATCFPVESIVFATIAIDAVVRQLTAHESRVALGELPNHPRSGWLARELRVFGDDIVVPTRYVHNVISRLVEFSAKPNATKSFWNGKFRESCGGDYYAGSDVKVIRLRRRLPRSRRDVCEVLSLISFRNQLYSYGYWGVVRLIDEALDRLKVPMPIVEDTSSVLGRRSVFGWRPMRWHPDLQAPLVKGLQVRTAVPESESSDHGKLLKCLLPGRNEPFHDAEHLTRTGRADRVTARVGWGTPF